MNWTLDSWTRQENVIATVDSPALAAAYTRNFEQLWDSGAGRQQRELRHRRRRTACGRGSRPAAGRELSHRIAEPIGARARRVRIASPLLTAGPILGTLAEVIAEQPVDIAGVCDATQVRQVFGQWAQNPRSRWKAPLLERCARGRSRGKRSTPYAPGAVHDYMHAKVTVADDTSSSARSTSRARARMNAENVLEIADAALADRLAGWIDELRARYPRRAAADPPSATAQHRAPG